MTAASLVRPLFGKVSATIADEQVRQESLAVADGLKRQDAGLLDELIVRYQHRLLRYLLYLCGNREMAEDLFQEVWMRVLVRGGQFNGKARFDTWLFTIARNLCLNELRRRSRHPADSIEETHPDNEDQPRLQIEDATALSPPEKLLQAELAHKIADAVAGLPENQRSAILLCRQEDLSYEEMAAILGCSLSATKSLIHRGRETLKEILKPYLKTGDWRG